MGHISSAIQEMTKLKWAIVYQNHLEITSTSLFNMKQSGAGDISGSRFFLYKHRTQQNVQRMNTDMERCDSSEEASAG